MNNFGTIELCSRLIYSDSCYIESAYYGIIDIIPGLYKCTNDTFVVESDDDEKHELVGSIELNNIACETDNLKWVKLTSDGIDSGTAGFYDYDYIQNIVASGKIKQWYNKIFEITYPLVDNPNYVPFEESKYCNTTEHKFINFALNIIMIPQCGALGAATASIIAELMVVIVQVFYLRKDLNFKKIFCCFCKYSVLSIIMGIIALFIDSLLVDGLINLILLR